MVKRNMLHSWAGLLLPALLTMALVGIAAGGSVSTPNVFVAGEPAVADDVNANFAAHEAAIDDNDARISVLESALAQTQAELLVLQARAVTHAYYPAQLWRTTVDSTGLVLPGTGGGLTTWRTEVGKYKIAIPKPVNPVADPGTPMVTVLPVGTPPHDIYVGGIYYESDEENDLDVWEIWFLDSETGLFADTYFSFLLLGPRD